MGDHQHSAGATMVRGRPRAEAAAPQPLSPTSPPPAQAPAGAATALNGIPKRLFDVVVGTLLFIVALPAMVVLAVAVVASLRTWRPLFFQQRIGRGGRPFVLPKLRTLPTNAPRYADKYTITSVRTTRVGRLLRATHLDELPQLALVAVGRMSLVGPRPEMACLLEQFPPEFVAARLSVRPGCTGLWQISADAAKLVGEVPHYDLYYVDHATARLDAWILAQTLRTLACRSGRALSIPAWTGAAARSEPPTARLPVDEAAPAQGEGTLGPLALPAL